MRIAWRATGVDYYVDGALVASHPVALSAPMFVYASNNAAAALSLDSIRLPSGLVVVDERGGEVRRAAALEDYFGGAPSAALWAWGSWSDGKSSTGRHRIVPS